MANVDWTNYPVIAVANAVFGETSTALANLAANTVTVGNTVFNTSLENIGLYQINISKILYEPLKITLKVPDTISISNNEIKKLEFNSKPIDIGILILPSFIVPFGKQAAKSYQYWG